MPNNEHNNFDKWFDDLEKNNYILDYSREIVKYYKSDVEILQKVCIRFTKIIMKIENICYFEKSLTIAEACVLLIWLGIFILVVRKFCEEFYFNELRYN